MGTLGLILCVAPLGVQALITIWRLCRRFFSANGKAWFAATSKRYRGVSVGLYVLSAIGVLIMIISLNSGTSTDLTPKQSRELLRQEFQDAPMEP